MQNTGRSNSRLYGLRYTVFMLLCCCFKFLSMHINIIVIYHSLVPSLVYENHIMSFLQYDSVCIQAVNLDLTHPKRVYFENVSLYT